MYKGINKNAGIVLDEQEAMAYFLRQCGFTGFDETAPDAAWVKEEVLGAFFSGDFMKVEA